MKTTVDTGKHHQSLRSAYNEANGDIPNSRAMFYDWDNFSINDENGLPYPEWNVRQSYEDGVHSIEEQAVRLSEDVRCESTGTTVEAAKCDIGSKHMHFVRVLYVAGYGPFAYEFLGDPIHESNSGY